MKVLVIIPAYNEELNIKKVVSNLIDHYPQYNYVVVNDSSCRQHIADLSPGRLQYHRPAGQSWTCRSFSDRTEICRSGRL